MVRQLEFAANRNNGQVARRWLYREKHDLCLDIER